MIVARDILAILDRSVSDHPPETGGILGSRDGEVIDSIVFDLSGRSASAGCSYAPDVNFLNQRIKRWQGEGVAFMGMFHTHFHSVRTLSCGDKHYIHAIMKENNQ